MIVDIGCGPNKREEADVGVDIREYDGVDIVCDIEEGLPFDDNEVNRILAFHVLEHVDDLPEVMAEIHRVLVPGGILKGKVPYYRDSDAYTDPTHKQYFTEQTFDYWDSTREYGTWEYFEPDFRIEYCTRIQRVQIWKARPLKFKLRTE